MKISFGKYDSAEEAIYIAKKYEDGRAAPVSGSELGVDSRDKAEDNKKTAFAQSGDRVEISEEARELQRAAATENPEADEEREDPYKDFAKDTEGLKNLFKNFGGAQESGAAGASDEEGQSTVTMLRKMIQEAQKKLEKAQEKLQEAMAKAQSAEDEVAKLAAQGEVEAAQGEVQNIQGEIQTLREELQKALQNESGSQDGQITQGPASINGGWQPSGQRISVGPNGITSLK